MRLQTDLNLKAMDDSTTGSEKRSSNLTAEQLAAKAIKEANGQAVTLETKQSLMEQIQHQHEAEFDQKKALQNIQDLEEDIKRIQFRR